MRRIGWLLIGLLLVACGGNATPTIPAAPAATVAPAATQDPAHGSLTATPNPVPSGTGNGTTTIRWAAPSGTSMQVWVSAAGAPETLFAEGSEGSQVAPWIESGKRYVFASYAGKAHAVPPLLTLTVTR